MLINVALGCSVVDGVEMCVSVAVGVEVCVGVKVRLTIVAVGGVIVPIEPLTHPVISIAIVTK
jgi:hypothetical protein